MIADHPSCFTLKAQIEVDAGTAHESAVRVTAPILLHRNCAAVALLDESQAAQADVHYAHALHTDLY